MKKSRKVTIIFLLAVIVLGGALLFIRTLDRKEIKDSLEPASVTKEEVSVPDEDKEAEPEPEEAVEEDLRVKVGPSEFPVILEDGDYENLNRANLIWTLNNLFEHVNNFEFSESTYSRSYHINGREVETNLSLIELGRGYRPKIRSSSNEIIDYSDIIEKDGIDHLVLDQAFMEAFIEASKYEEVTDELNAFIDRLNRIKSADIDNLTEAEIDSMFYIDPNINEDGLDLEDKRKGLREFAVGMHFQSTNVFWIGGGTEKDLYPDGDDGEAVFLGRAIEYSREDHLRAHYYLKGQIDHEAPPPSNFDPRLHTDPDEEPFIWVPAGTWEFIYHKRQWKVAIFRPVR